MEVNVDVLKKAIMDIKLIHGVAWQEVTEKSGVHNIGRIANGDIIPTSYSWERLHEAFPAEVPPVEYVDRNGQVYKITTSEISGFNLIPKYKARLSGGAGSLETSDQIESNFAFRKDWISNRHSDNLALFEVVGDSMSPFIQEGDVVLVDLNQNLPENIIDGKTFAIREDHTIKIKRLLHQGSDLIIRSQDRENFPDYVASKEDFQLLGRVVWVGHEVR